MYIRLLSINIILHICLIVTASKLSTDAGYVVMISPPFFGHLIPLLDLAKGLSEHHHVTFVLSASKLDELKRRELLPENFNLEFIELFDHNEEDYQVTDSTAAFSIDTVISRMNEPLKELFFISPSSTPLLSTGSIRHPIDLIIYDPFVYIAAEIARQRHIPVHCFLPNNLISLSRFINISMGKNENSIITPELATQIVQSYSSVDGILCNSFYQFDKHILNELYQNSLLKTNVTVRFIAPLISSTNEHQNINTMERIQSWLNAQHNTSKNLPFIIYVAFGSIARLQPEQLVEIAQALQNYSVIWSLKTSLQTHLPSTFVENPNHLLLNWSPQRFILSQSSVRLFISHGGWNSLMESMLAGKITLVWPVFADQFVNGYRLEKELHIGRSIKNLTDMNKQRIFRCNELENYVKDIFDHEKMYFDNAQEVQQMIRNAQRTDALQSFQDIIQIIDNQRINRLNQHDDL